jgi:hypothetical protein
MIFEHEEVEHVVEWHPMPEQPQQARERPLQHATVKGTSIPSAIVIPYQDKTIELEPPVESSCKHETTNSAYDNMSVNHLTLEALPAAWAVASGAGAAADLYVYRCRIRCAGHVGKNPCWSEWSPLAGSAEEGCPPGCVVVSDTAVGCDDDDGGSEADDDDGGQLDRFYCAARRPDPHETTALLQASPTADTAYGTVAQAPVLQRESEILQGPPVHDNEAGSGGATLEVNTASLASPARDVGRRSIVQSA